MYDEFCILASFSCYKVTRPLIIEQKYVKNLLTAASCMLEGNLVSKMACLLELQGIFYSSLISMLASIDENF